MCSAGASQRRRRRDSASRDATMLPCSVLLLVAMLVLSCAAVAAEEVVQAQREQSSVVDVDKLLHDRYGATGMILEYSPCQPLQLCPVEGGADAVCGVSRLSSNRYIVCVECNPMVYCSALVRYVFPANITGITSMWSTHCASPAGVGTLMLSAPCKTWFHTISACWRVDLESTAAVDATTDNRAGLCGGSCFGDYSCALSGGLCPHCDNGQCGP